MINITLHKKGSSGVLIHILIQQDLPKNIKGFFNLKQQKTTIYNIKNISHSLFFKCSWQKAHCTIVETLV